MRPDLCDIIRCPQCGGGLNLKREVYTENDIQSGVVGCQGCQAEFPIRDGILVLLKDFDVSEIHLRDEIAQTITPNADIIARAAPHYFVPAMQRHVRDFVTRVEPGWIMDLGIGMGWYWQKVDPACHIAGVDFSFETLLKTRRFLGPQVDLICMDVCTLRLQKNCLRGVWSSQVLQHFEESSKTEELMRAVYYGLVERGVFELRWLSRAALIVLARRLLGKSYGKEQRTGELFIRRFTSSELRQLVATVFDTEKITIRYEENLFHPELGIRTRHKAFDRIERRFELSNFARLTARVLMAQAVK